MRNRLRRLEEKGASFAKHIAEVRPEVRVVMKAEQRVAAEKAGKPVPPWTEEELNELYREELKTVNGKGVAVRL